MGAARFLTERTVGIELNDGGTGLVWGRTVLINTGTAPAIPPIDGILCGDGTRAFPFWTSEDVPHLEEFPGTWSSWVATLGVHVTLLEGGAHVLGREDVLVWRRVQGVERMRGRIGPCCTSSSSSRESPGTPAPRSA